MSNRTVISAVIEQARSYVGLRSRANRVNGFGAKTGFNGQPWDGSFLETVMREISIYPGTSLTSSTASLAYFVRTNRVYRKPKVGDLVYFATGSAGEPFAQPHVGLVTEVRDWKRFNRFTVIEAEVNPGTAKGHTEPDGVYERVRYGTDVLAFVRPVYGPLPKPEIPDGVPVLRPSVFQNGKVSKGTVLLQQALHLYLGDAARDFEKGRFDAMTRSAVRRFQHEVGLLNGDGTVDDETLYALARLTGYRFFRARKLGE